MDVQIHCPKCSQLLDVPANASGHRVRCPACAEVFVAPEADDLIEDTVSAWIEQDVEDVLTEVDRSTESMASAPAIKRPDKPHAAPSAAPKPPAPPAPEKPKAPDPPTGKPSNQKPKRVFARTERRSIKRRREDPSQLTLDGTPAELYPSDLTQTEARPRLFVRKVDHAGVRFAFDSIWLKHQGFRASMPVRCAFSGLSEVNQLIARPLVFLDRSRARKPDLETISHAHEQHTLGDRTPRQLSKQMGLIELMPSPFKYAMPYYVSNRYAHLSIHCETRDRSEDEGITCEVLVPDGLTALAWLANVNGICGKAYEMLEHDVSLLHGDAWRELPEEVRQRLQVWCKLRPREELRLYISDADFGRKDMGLAGVMVTDSRVAYCKYHHRGQVRLDNEDATIVIKPEGKFANLILVVGHDRSRMVKVTDQDAKRLATALRGNEGLSVAASR